MSYSSLTRSVTTSAMEYIAKEWVHSENTNVFKKQVLARGGHLLLTPFSAVTSVADTIIGIGAGFAAIATGGKHKPTFKFAAYYLMRSNEIVALPYVNVLKTLNPQAKVFEDPSNPLISYDGNGFITSVVQEALESVAISCCESDNCIKRHVASRLTYVLLAITSIITRVVDAIIGVIVATLSFLTLGKIGSINNLAYRTLQAPGMVSDLFFFTIKFINP